MSRSTARPLLVPVLLLALFLVALLPAALGWGDVGHSLIGRVAMSQLTPAAAALLTVLAPASTAVAPRPDGPNPNATTAGNLSDPGIGSWPDRIRANTSAFYFTDSWHFFNTRDWQCYYDATLDCPSTGCVNTAIQNYTGRAADTSIGLQERQYALAFMVHFIEDLHQPLHGGFASDQDGNRITGAFATSTTSYARTNLHALWDTSLIDTRIRRDFAGNPDQYYRYLLLALSTQHNESVAGWRRCSASSQYADNYYACSDDWSQESARLACSSAYTMPDSSRLSVASTLSPVSTATAGEAYYQQSIPVIELRMLQAGVRLANVLNTIAAGGTGGGGGDNGGGGGGGTTEDGVSNGTAGLLVFIIVVLIVALLMFVALYYRKEKLGLPGLFSRSSAGSMGLIGGGDSGSGGGYGRSGDRMTSSLL